MPGHTRPPSPSTLTLPSDTEVELVRSFAAPRELVWRAFTEPALLRRWNSPAGAKMTACDMDVRPGGSFRWAWAFDGGSFETAGRIHRVEKPRLLVMESMDPDPTPEVRTITFEESNGRTVVTMRIKTATKEIRDALLASGAMEMEGVHAQLDALLVELA